MARYHENLGDHRDRNYKFAMSISQDESRRNRDEDAEEERRYWEAIEDDERAERERREEAKRVGIEKMEAWFFDQFENPEVEMPRDSDEQIYIFPWGGPFDAGDMLRDHFGHDYEESWIAETIESIEKDGTFEWAPTSHGDFYEHPEPDRAETERAQLGAQILMRLDELEHVIQSLGARPNSMGHNQPPDDIGLPPYSEEDRQVLAATIDETRTELQSPAPDAAKLATLSSRFRRVGALVGAWLAKKADLAVDEAIKTSIKAASWTAAVALLTDLGDDLIALAKLILAHV
jgi:hypothetical protein